MSHPRPSRTRSLVAVVGLLLVAPLVATIPSSAANAAEAITVRAHERGSGHVVPGACYSVQDVGRGGFIASGCDEDDDGEVVLTTTDACTQCRVHQSLPNLSPGVPTAHLPEPAQDGGWHSYEFDNYLKPFLRVAYRDAHTGAPLPGACLAVNETGSAGAVFAGCDGDPGGGAGDQDGATNAEVETRRLSKAGSYTVTTSSSRLPTGYLKPAAVVLVAAPAETGDVVTHAIDLVGSSSTTIRTVDAKRRKSRVTGACYQVTDRTLGARLGTFCDGSGNGPAGDLDKKKNGVVRLGHLPAGHTLVLDQQRVPRKYRLARANRTVLTVADRTVGVTVRNRRR